MPATASLVTRGDPQRSVVNSTGTGIAALLTMVSGISSKTVRAIMLTGLHLPVVRLSVSVHRTGMSLSCPCVLLVLSRGVLAVVFSSCHHDGGMLCSHSVVSSHLAIAEASVCFLSGPCEVPTRSTLTASLPCAMPGSLP